MKGWVRFSINQQTMRKPKPSNRTDDSDWTIGYYSTRVDRIRSILDQGQPLPYGKLPEKLQI